MAVSYVNEVLRSELEVFTEPGRFVFPVPEWADRMDIVMLSGGDGGSVGKEGQPGVGGNAGRWTALTVTRSDPAWGRHFVGFVGKGGTHGTLLEQPGEGGETVVGVAVPLKRFPVKQGSATYTGDSPGAIEYNGRVYSGGAQQNEFGNDGISPGGGGSGITPPFTAAGDGAPGAVWVYCQQLVPRTQAAANSGILSRPTATARFPDHAPEVFEYDKPGTFNFVIPWWCHAIDIVTLSGGAGGGGGGIYSSPDPAARGHGGTAGTWDTATIIKGRDITWFLRSLTVTVGDGGLGGQPGSRGQSGGHSAVSHTVTSAESPAATGNTGIVDGAAAGAINYHQSLGIPANLYSGGAATTTPGDAGAAPGSGGAGGDPNQPGGNGAPGKVWIICYQIAGWTGGIHRDYLYGQALTKRTDIPWSWALYKGQSKPSAVWRPKADLKAIYHGKASPYGYALRIGSGFTLAKYQSGSHPDATAYELPHSMATYIGNATPDATWMFPPNQPAVYIGNATPDAHVTAYTAGTYGGKSRDSGLARMLHVRHTAFRVWHYGQVYQTAGTFQWTVPDWADAVDVVLLGGGGSGHGGMARGKAGGGQAGRWRGLTFIVGRDISPGSIIEVTLNDPGAAVNSADPKATGNPGGVTLSIAETKYFDDAAGGQGGVAGDDPTGGGAGMYLYNGRQYWGSDPQTTIGADGKIPGGGGAGGGTIDGAQSGSGAIGRVWCFAYQYANHVDHPKPPQKQTAVYQGHSIYTADRATDYDGRWPRSNVGGQPLLDGLFPGNPSTDTIDGGNPQGIETNTGLYIGKTVHFAKTVATGVIVPPPADPQEYLQPLPANPQFDKTFVGHDRQSVLEGVLHSIREINTTPPVFTDTALLACMITAAEWAAGVINHPLVWNGTIISSVCVPPATSTTGKNYEGVTHPIPAGTRVVLDPTIDLSTMDLAPGERILGIALQKYGAYAAGHHQTAIMSFVAESGLTYDASNSLDKPGQPSSRRLHNLPWRGNIWCCTNWNGA